MARVVALCRGRSYRAGRRAALAIAPALVALLWAPSALAQAQHIPVTGQDMRFFGAPAKVWAADGLTQIRDLPQTGTFSISGTAVSMSGPESDLVNGTLDATGSGHAWGKFSFTDAATGVTCSGISTGQITNALAVNTIVAHCSNGALLTGTLTDIESFPPGQVPPVWIKSDFSGVLLTPG